MHICYVNWWHLTKILLKSGHFGGWYLKIQLKGSVKQRRTVPYPFHFDFSSCSESTEIWHAYSFCVKNVPVFSFSRRQKKMDQIARKSPPPLCPSPNIAGFRSLRTKTLCMCVFYAIGVGGGGGGAEGGWTFKNVFEASFPRLWKKHGHKESACHISVDSEQLEKSQQNRYIRLALTEPFSYFVFLHQKPASDNWLFGLCDVFVVTSKIQQRNVGNVLCWNSFKFLWCTMW